MDISNGLWYLRCVQGGKRLIRKLVVASLSALPLAGCAFVQAGPARTDGTYASKAAQTASSVHSATETALLSIDLADASRITANALSVQLDDVATDASGAHQSFDSVQPPSDKSDALRNQLDDLLVAADNALSELLNDARHHDMAKLDKQRASLQQLSQQLNDLDDQLS